MVKQGLHNIKELTLEKPEQLKSGTWVRHLYIYIKGHSHPVEISLFGETPEAITIKPVRQDEC